MCIGGSSPTPPAPPPPLPEPATKASPEVKAARDDEKKRLKAMAGAASTTKTSSLGLPNAANVGKQKLGQ